MLRTRHKMDLSQRVAICYLVFGLAGAVVLVAGVLFAIGPTGQQAAGEQGPAWQTLVSGWQSAPLMILIPLGIQIAGLVLIRRAVRPAGQVEAQLEAASTQDAVNPSELQPVQPLSAASVGWNRLLDRLHTGSGDLDQDEQLRKVISGFRQSRTTQIIDSLPDGIAVTDANYHVKVCNRSFGILLGIEDQETENADIRKLLDSGSEQKQTDGDGESGESGDIAAPAVDQGDIAEEEHPAEQDHDPDFVLRSTREIHRKTATGERVLRVSRFPLAATGDVASDKLVWTVRDVTQQKLGERMRDEFLDCATHELRTPLANIKAYAETLSLSEMLDVEQQKEFCNTINSEATRLARFIDDLLNISSVEAGSMMISREKVELGRMLTDIESKIRPTMEQKQIEFRISIPEKLPEVMIDKDKVNVTLVNLLGNAAKYTPPGGTASLNVKLGDDRLLIDIQDSGIGISAEELPRVFDKFFRSDDQRVREQSGTGLGLALAQKVIELHGGKITVSSELDKGTTFHIELPLVRAGVDPMAEAERRQS